MQTSFCGDAFFFFGLSADEAFERCEVLPLDESCELAFSFTPFFSSAGIGRDALGCSEKGSDEQVTPKTAQSLTICAGETSADNFDL